MRKTEQSILGYKGENQRLQEECTQAHEGWKVMKMKCNLAEKELAGLREQLQMNRSENHHLQHSIQALQEELCCKEQEIKTLQTASHHKEATHSQVVALLETHTSELECT